MLLGKLGFFRLVKIVVLAEIVRTRVEHAELLLLENLFLLLVNKPVVYSARVVVLKGNLLQTGKINVHLGEVVDNICPVECFLNPNGGVFGVHLNECFPEFRLFKDQYFFDNPVATEQTIENVVGEKQRVFIINTD